ncbi:MAG TPA: ABC transporter permease [Actinomycetota bacterium]
MFLVTYIRRELRRRLGRTILTVLGLALGVGLVAAITSVSRGLDQAQDQVLNPLASVGTDLMVTRPVSLGGDADEPARGPFGLDATEMRRLAAENAGVTTDLSKLGKPGEEFERDTFLAASQLTFDAAQADDVRGIDGVEAVGVGLTLSAVHQEGTVPKIQTGGETFNFSREFTLSDDERAQIRRCFAQAFEGGPRPGGSQDGAPPASAQECAPRSFQFEGSFTTPRELLEIQTDITSGTYTAAGIDLSQPGLGLITQAQIVEGSFFAGGGAKEVVLSESYAQREEIEVGETFSISGEKFAVAGLAQPPLGGESADVYLPLGELQRLSDREGRSSALFVRASDAGSVAAVRAAIEDALPGARVTSAEELAGQISGSLVDAANLADRLGLILSIVLLVAAFLFASLLTLSSVAKRVRELGTLKAIGWRKGLVVRQVVGESLAQGLLGGLLGVALGVGAALAIAAFIPPLDATAQASGDGGFFGLGRLLGGAGETRTETIALHAVVDAATIALALGLAVLGGLIAGAVGALRSARLRPADALRQVG